MGLEHEHSMGARERVTGGAAVVKALRAEGVDTIFGIPAAHIIYIYDAFLDEPGIRRILARHEQGAAFMADGYARATGRPGVVIVTDGPGVTNTATAVSEAYVDSIPLLVISSQTATPYVGQERGNLHEMKDQSAFMRSVTGAQYSVRRVADIPHVIHAAMRAFQTERPRPVHIEIPTDVLSATEEVVFAPPETYPRQVADEAVLDQAADLLRTAQRPLIYAGGGVVASGAEKELLRLAQVLDAPVMTTIMGKGAIPEDHPLSLGPSRRLPPAGRALVAESDVLLAIGTKLGAMATENWKLPLPGNLIHVDIDPTVIGASYPTRLGVVGDAKVVLEQLLVRLTDLPPRPSREEQVGEANRQRLRQLWRRTPQHMRILTALRNALDRNAIVAWDMTLVGYVSTDHFPVYQSRSYLYPWTSGTLGFGLPAAIGAKVGQPGAQVVSISGDGGFLFTGEELAAAVQHRLPVVSVVLNDQCYSAVKRLHEAEFPGRAADVMLSRVDYVKLAEAYGAEARRVPPDELGAAIAEALRRSGPVLIEVPVSLEPGW